MQKKAIALKNLGMNRDMSISKIGETNAYENYNIRILARDNDTLLSVTNERGNAEITLSGANGISGDYLVGRNVLNDYLILFLTDDSGHDYIYRVDFSKQTPELVLLFPTNANVSAGDVSLNFSSQNPIESIVYYESDTIQKIYWVDGRNPLRMMNFVADSDEMAKWDSTYFDANRELRFGVDVNISKDNSGNARPNGTIQYLLTYFNKHGQETGYAWMSDIVYLSPLETGGSADETNNNRITLTLSGLDTRFTNYRVYSVFRSSYDGVPVAYIVQDGEIEQSGNVVVVDDAANQVSTSASSLLFLGSQSVVPGTMAHKDDTLFLGDLNYDGRNYDALEEVIAQNMRDRSGNSTCITFEYSTGADYPIEEGLYSYENQLIFNADDITTFKGNEKYRFALTFRTKHGKQTEAFWIGDATNILYPVIDATNNVIKRVVAKCDVPPAVISVLKDPQYDFDLSVMQLMIAEATYADRSVKAQGVINPTVFNTWSRYNNRIYSVPSWMTRPRNSVIANRHFDVIHNSINSTGEIECNHWDSVETPKPYYQYKNYLTSNQDFVYQYEGLPQSDYSMLIIKLVCSEHSLLTGFRFDAVAFYVTSRVDPGYDSEVTGLDFTGKNIFPGEYTGTHCVVGSKSAGYGTLGSTYDKACHAVYVGLKEAVINDLHVPSDMFINEDQFKRLCDVTPKGDTPSCVNAKYIGNMGLTPSSKSNSPEGAANYAPPAPLTSADRWTSNPNALMSNEGRYVPSYYMQHLSFIDENVATLNSPELFYNATSLDNTSGCKLRIVGVAKITSNISDYTVDASHGMLPGQNLASINFSGTKKDSTTNGLQSWPLWDEYGLYLAESEDPDDFSRKDARELSSADYSKGPGSVVRYWLYMWDNAGAIDNYTDENNFSYGVIRHKVFANMKFAYSTVYNSIRQNDWISDLNSIRVFNNPSSQILSLNIDKTVVNYDGSVDELLSVPGELKYPVTYSTKAPELNEIAESQLAYMYSNAPVPITYDTNPHAVFSLPTAIVKDSANLNVYKQTILPRLSGEGDVSIASRDINTGITGALLPWRDSENGNDPSTSPGQVSGSILYIDAPVSRSFTLTTFSESSMTATLELEDTAANIASISAIFSACRDYAGSRYVYLRVAANCSWDQKYDDCIFLVDIMYFANYDSTHILLPYSKVAGFEKESDTNVIRTVQYISYSAGTPPTFSDNGYMQLTVGDGATDPISGYTFLDYQVDSTTFNLVPNTEEGAENVGPNDEYVFIGELYYPFGENGIEDTRYGDVKNNSFVIAGPQYNINDMSSSFGTHNYIVANHGDTYFQRWDDLRVKPHSEDDVNSVVDIVSVMLETHINIDGRTDNNRGTKYIASMNNAQFNSLNKAYSQPNNFVSQRDLDADFNLDTYRNYLTWTLQKASMAETDEWMHITLANSLALDGDKGVCRAIRRFQNSLVAFQDRSISEILFNSRTQIPVSEGVPIEIANSGKVDGKRVISNNYGCLNKWSIVEGKSALYFVDNINKAFCGFDGQSINNISSRFGFDAIFRRSNSTEVWNPKDQKNVVSFYDRIHSDVYLMFDYPAELNEAGGSLVFSETLGQFTTFLGYTDVPMMTNIGHRFISFRKSFVAPYANKLWAQNEGLYCNFFGRQDDFYVTYNTIPEPYADKIWTNLEYRADFYKVFDNFGNETDAESILDGGDIDGATGNYLKDETFDKLVAWNEYQTTGTFTADASTKKFRIWRTQIPRAIITETNKYGFDRIRNPWMKLFMGKDMSGDDNKNMVQLHDVNVIYYE